MTHEWIEAERKRVEQARRFDNAMKRVREARPNRGTKKPKPVPCSKCDSTAFFLTSNLGTITLNCYRCKKTLNIGITILE